MDSLREAMYELIETRDVSEIKVVDLIRKAGVSRGGFLHIDTCRDMQRSAWFTRLNCFITPEDLPDTAEEAPDDTLADAIMRLPTKYRDVILLYYDQNMTMPEIAQALGDLGTRSDDAVSWVLIDADPHPVWKIRMGTFPANTLYEVDAMTGEILDRELYVCQNPDFDHDMKMFTLRSVYMPAALAEFGPVRIAMELTVKAHREAFSWDETVFMNPNCYEITVDGMTVTFKSIDRNLPSYRTTILKNGMDAEIVVFDIPEPSPEGEGSPYGNG